MNDEGHPETNELSASRQSGAFEVIGLSMGSEIRKWLPMVIKKDLG